MADALLLLGQVPLTAPDQQTHESLDTRPAPRWKVIGHDDPITTMDFVVEVLRSVFGLSQARAYERMMRIHTCGSALIGRWGETEARRRVERATSKARAMGFPLTFTLEEED